MIYTVKRIDEDLDLVAKNEPKTLRLWQWLHL